MSEVPRKRVIVLLDSTDSEATISDWSTSSDDVVIVEPPRQRRPPLVGGVTLLPRTEERHVVDYETYRYSDETSIATLFEKTMLKPWGYLGTRGAIDEVRKKAETGGISYSWDVLWTSSKDQKQRKFNIDMGQFYRLLDYLRRPTTNPLYKRTQQILDKAADKSDNDVTDDE